jgi:8-oxo-dGTP pyrophosphatase MutT (NUDIX family)
VARALRRDAAAARSRAVSTCLLLEARERRGFFWFARRSETLGGYWSWSAAGGVDPGEEHASAVVREACEELGLQPQALEGLRLLGINHSFGFCSVWHALLAPGAAFTPEPFEVAAMALRAHPSQLEPVSASLHSLWPALEALLQAEPEEVQLPAGQTAAVALAPAAV